MLNFLIYDGKVAIALLAFYLFYRFLLKKETFHRFNRVVLMVTAALSFLLPLCIITIHRPIEIQAMDTVAVLSEMPEGIALAAESHVQWWTVSLFVLFWAGAAFVLIRVAVSIISITRIVRQGDYVQEEDGCKIIVTERDIAPFSWMRYIVLSRKDWEGSHAPIIAHEKAHIRYGHSVELLLVDILSALQWFNPAIWMLRSDLKELHEYEADDAVLRSGVNIKEYQYLLIRKAVGKSGYSVANSFNHSILKNRITMMSKSKSPLVRGLRVLYLLPLMCLGIGLQAQTAYDLPDKVNQNDGNPQSVNGIKIGPEGVTPLFILKQAWGDEKEITREEFKQIEGERIKSVEIMKEDAAKEKYGEKADGGVVVITLKRPQELNEIVVVRYADDEDEAIAEELIPSVLANPDTMPTFQGGDMNNFSHWLNQRIVVPKSCKHSGTMKISFVVDAKGNVGGVQIAEGVCEELDAMMLSLVEQSPKWEPAKHQGKPTPQVITLPVVFQMR